MSELVQKMLLVFGAVMVAAIGLLLVLQVALGSIATEEPQMINLRSLAVSALFAAGLTFGIANRD